MSKIQLWNGLNRGEQLVLLWYNWLWWDMVESCSQETSLDFVVFFAFVSEYFNVKKVPLDTCPIINEKNYISVWFEINRELDVESLKSLEWANIFDYELKKRWRGWTLECF